MSVHIAPDSSTWLQEFTPYLNGKRVKWPDLHLNLLEGEVCELTLDYEYSWLIGDPDAFICMEYVSGEAGQGLVFDPPLGQELKMAEGSTSLTWMITSAGAPSGSHILQFAIPRMGEMPKSPPVPIAVLDIAQELDIKFDTFSPDVGGAAYPCLGAEHVFKLRAKPGSPLVGSLVMLEWEGETAESLGVTVTPALEKDLQLDLEWLSWTLDCRKSAKGGAFSLRLKMTRGDGLVFQPLVMMVLAHNLVRAVTWREEIELGNGDTMIQHGIRATSRFTEGLARGVQVTVQRSNSSEPSYATTSHLGEVLVNTLLGVRVELTIYNRYDGSVV